MSSCSAEIGATKTATSLGGSSIAPLRSRRWLWREPKSSQQAPGGPLRTVAVIIPNDQWSPSQQGEEEEEEDDWSEFMPS